MQDMEVRIERLDSMRAIYTHVLSDTPEEDAMKRIIAWAVSRGLLQADVKPRLFGRNSYPTDNPELHGYECYLTVNSKRKPEGDIDVAAIEGGVFAVLRFKNLFKIQEAWQHLWDRMKKQEYEHKGLIKGKHGFSYQRGKNRSAQSRSEP